MNTINTYTNNTTTNTTTTTTNNNHNSMNNNNTYEYHCMFTVYDVTLRYVLTCRDVS